METVTGLSEILIPEKVHLATEAVIKIDEGIS